MRLGCRRARCEDYKVMIERMKEVTMSLLVWQRSQNGLVTVAVVEASTGRSRDHGLSAAVARPQT